jgi:hypothetical protein
MQEKSHLIKALLSNGYSLSQINHAFHSAKPKPKISSSSSPPHALISLPYIQGTNDHISKFWLRRISKPCSNPTKPSNNFLELLKINLTLCLDKEFTKFLPLVVNLT